MFPKKDKYLKSRGGTFKIYKIYCKDCGAFLFHYQKDGPGILKRLYLDRIDQSKDLHLKGKCHQCKKNFGVAYIYEKENRPAIRLFVGAVKKSLKK